MKGYRLIRVDDYGNNILHHETGTVEYRPKLKWRIEKKNAFDPSFIHRRDSYHEDELNLTAVVSPEGYNELETFLSTAGTFYVEFEHQGGRRQQFPVIVDDLPKCPDDLHEYPTTVEFSLISRYRETPGYVNFPYDGDPVSEEPLFDEHGEKLCDHTGESLMARIA